MASAASREAILDAALRLFHEHGIAPTSMDRVRRAARVSNGSLFHHFPTKDRLAGALYLRALSSYHEMIVRTLRRHRHAERGIRAVVRSHVTWVLEHPEQTRMLDEARRSDAVAAIEDDLSALNRRLFASVKTWLKPHVESGTVRDVPFDVFVAIILGPAMELTRAWIRRRDRDHLKRIAPILGDAAWRAIAAE